jgi:hypothetical protein
LGRAIDEFDDARIALKCWVVHIAHSEEERHDLVARSHAAASDNPFMLPEHEPVEWALMSPKLRIAKTVLTSATEPRIDHP